MAGPVCGTYFVAKFSQFINEKNKTASNFFPGVESFHYIFLCDACIGSYSDSNNEKLCFRRIYMSIKKSGTVALYSPCYGGTCQCNSFCNHKNDIQSVKKENPALPPILLIYRHFKKHQHD